MSTTLHIRPSDCDRFGHVNNACYISYIQHAFAETLIDTKYADDWKPDSEFFWRLTRLSIEYRQAAIFGDLLEAHTWLIDPVENQPAFGCEILKKEDGSEQTEQSVIRHQALWQRICRETCETSLINQAFLRQFPQNGGNLPRAFKLPPDNPDLKRYILEHKVMRSEVEAGGFARPQAIYNWLEEGVFDASAEAGWTPEQRLASGVLIFQMRHDTEFFAFPQNGDTIRIISRLAEVKRFRGTWLQEMLLMPQQILLLRDYSTGIFVNLEGKPTSPSKGSMRNIQFGECGSLDEM